MYCNKCGAENPDSCSFCKQCGEPSDLTDSCVNKATPGRAAPAYYVGALITSMIGAVLLIVTDFGWWYTRDYYYHTEEWGWVNLTASAWSGFIISLLIAGLLFCAYVSFRGLRSPEAIPRKMVRTSFLVALGVTILTIIGGIVFAVAVSDTTEWDFDAGFYGGLIGGILTTVFTKIALRHME